MAAWVGAGGYGAGPGGSDEWIQAGLSAFPGSSGRLYYEVKRPGSRPRYVEVRRGIRPAERLRIAVVQLTGRAGWWRAKVDGRSVGPPVFLPGSTRRWRPLATAESWDGGKPACNRYAYRFGAVALATAPGGSWRPLSRGAVLADRGYRVIRDGPATFVASSRRQPSRA